MKLKFVDQPYQTDAVNAICDIFDGSEVKDSLFTIENNRNKKYSSFEQSGLGLTGDNFDYYIGHSNKVSIDDFTMLENVQKPEVKS